MFSDHIPVQVEFYSVLKNSKIQMEGEFQMFFNRLKNFYFTQGISDLCKGRRTLSPSSPLLFSAQPQSPMLPTEHHGTMTSVQWFSPRGPHSRGYQRAAFRATGSGRETTVFLTHLSPVQLLSELQGQF